MTERTVTPKHQYVLTRGEEGGRSSDRGCGGPHPPSAALRAVAVMADAAAAEALCSPGFTARALAAARVASNLRGAAAGASGAALRQPLLAAGGDEDEKAVAVSSRAGDYCAEARAGACVPHLVGI